MEQFDEDRFGFEKNTELDKCPICGSDEIASEGSYIISCGATSDDKGGLHGISWHTWDGRCKKCNRYLDRCADTDGYDSGWRLSEPDPS